MILLISSKVAFAFEDKLPISFFFSCNKSTVSASSSEMALDIPESDDNESTGTTADVVVDAAISDVDASTDIDTDPDADGHKSDVVEISSHIFNFVTRFPKFLVQKNFLRPLGLSKKRNSKG